MTKNYLLIAFLFTSCLIASCSLLGDGDGDGNNPLGATTLDCVITNDITLTNHNDNGVDYIVDCELDLRARMDIEEGTIIEFREGGGVEITQGGSIKAAGIGGSPVIFRGQDSGISSWKGIFISTDQTTSDFDFVEIHDAGDGESWSLFRSETAAITLDGRIRFTNSQIINSAGHGIWSSSELFASDLTSFENNTIMECGDFPLLIRSSFLDGISLESCTFEQNGENIVAFDKDGSIMDENVTLKALDVPYLFTDEVLVGAGLTIEAGVQILMGEGVTFTNSSSTEAMIFAGTATNRISIGGKESQAGYWPGILIRNDANHIFENVDIADGGSTSAGASDTKANITLEFDSQLTMIDCTSARSNSSCDVLVHQSGGTPTFTNMSSDLMVCNE